MFFQSIEAAVQKNGLTMKISQAEDGKLNVVIVGGKDSLLPVIALTDTPAELDRTLAASLSQIGEQIRSTEQALAELTKKVGASCEAAVKKASEKPAAKAPAGKTTAASPQPAKPTVSRAETKPQAPAAVSDDGLSLF